MRSTRRGTLETGTWVNACPPGRLIANPRLKFHVTAKDFSQLQISNREQIAIFTGRPGLSSPATDGLSRGRRSPTTGRWGNGLRKTFRSRIGFYATSHLRLATEFLIVNPESKFRATRRKQSPSRISNRYKRHFSISLFTPLSSLPNCAIMSRNYFTHRSASDAYRAEGADAHSDKSQDSEI
jgi:hypothetical protein